MSSVYVIFPGDTELSGSPAGPAPFVREENLQRLV